MFLSHLNVYESPDFSGFASHRVCCVVLFLNLIIPPKSGVLGLCCIAAASVMKEPNSLFGEVLISKVLIVVGYCVRL